MDGVPVRLQVPAPAAAEDASEQLGLATPGFAEVSLGPGALHKCGSGLGLLVAAKACSESDSADALFRGAAGVLVGETTYRIESWQALWAGDRVFGYSLELAAPGQTS